MRLAFIQYCHPRLFNQAIEAYVSFMLAPEYDVYARVLLAVLIVRMMRAGQVHRIINYLEAHEANPKLSIFDNLISLVLYMPIKTFAQFMKVLAQRSAVYFSLVEVMFKPFTPIDHYDRLSKNIIMSVWASRVPLRLTKQLVRLIRDNNLDQMEAMFIVDRRTGFDIINRDPNTPPTNNIHWMTSSFITPEYLNAVIIDPNHLTTIRTIYWLTERSNLDRALKKLYSSRIPIECGEFLPNPMPHKPFHNLWYKQCDSPISYAESCAFFVSAWYRFDPPNLGIVFLVVAWLHALGCYRMTNLFDNPASYNPMERYLAITRRLPFLLIKQIAMPQRRMADILPYMRLHMEHFHYYYQRP